MHGVKSMVSHQVVSRHSSHEIVSKDMLEGLKFFISDRVDHHRGVTCVSIPERSLNQKNLAASCQGQSADLSCSQVGDRRGGRGG